MKAYICDWVTVLVSVRMRSERVSRWESWWVSTWMSDSEGYLLSEWVSKWVSWRVSNWKSESVDEGSEWVSQLMCLWVSNWMIDSVSEFISEWVSWWVSRWVNQWLNNSASEWVTQCVNELLSYCMCDWVSEGVSEWIRKLPCHSAPACSSGLRQSQSLSTSSKPICSVRHFFVIVDWSDALCHGVLSCLCYLLALSYSYEAIARPAGILACTLSKCTLFETTLWLEHTL